MESLQNFKVNSGVRQGDPLSPTMFILGINSVLLYIREKFKGYKIMRKKSQHLIM